MPTPDAQQEAPPVVTAPIAEEQQAPEKVEEEPTSEPTPEESVEQLEPETRLERSNASVDSAPVKGLSFIVRAQAEDERKHEEAGESVLNQDDDMDMDIEEEPVRRPSWAPPPLIDIDSDNSSSPSNSPPNATESPTKKVARRLSWLNPRTGSSSASENSSDSPSPSLGPKRNSLRMLASQIKAKMTKAKDTWETKIGDALPHCNRCGRPIEPHHKIVTAGVARAHEVCPSKEESERGPRNPRYMVQKAQGRVVLTFRCDKDTKQPYTFIFDLDTDSKQQCLRMRNNAEMTLTYTADEKSHATLERKFKIPKTREFDISVRYTHQFGFSNPATGENVTPELDLVGKKVTVTKYCTSNEVLHKIVAGFTYDEENRVLHPLHLSFTYSMMPGAQLRLPTIINRGQVSEGMAKRLEEKLKEKQEAAALARAAESGGAVPVSNDEKD